MFYQTRNINEARERRAYYIDQQLLPKSFASSLSFLHSHFISINNSFSSFSIDSFFQTLFKIPRLPFFHPFPPLSVLSSFSSPVGQRKEREGDGRGGPLRVVAHSTRGNLCCAHTCSTFPAPPPCSAFSISCFFLA